MIVASSDLKSLANSKIVILNPTRAEIDVAFRLRMRHTRRFVALMVAIFGWRVWRLSISRANFPSWRIVKIFHLSKTLVVEWIELREATIRGVPVMHQWNAHAARG